MRVRMLKLAAGPGGVLQPGREFDLPSAVAVALIEAGAAEVVAVRVVDRGETATLPPAETRGDDFAKIPYISGEIADILRLAGYASFDDLRQATDEALLALPSLAAGRLKSIRKFLDSMGE